MIASSFTPFKSPIVISYKFWSSSLVWREPKFLLIVSSSYFFYCSKVSYSKCLTYNSLVNLLFWSSIFFIWFSSWSILLKFSSIYFSLSSRALNISWTFFILFSWAVSELEGDSLSYRREMSNYFIWWSKSFRLPYSFSIFSLS